MNSLADLGWQPFFQSQLTEAEKISSTAARIVEPSRGLSRAKYIGGETWAEQSLQLEKGSAPAVGDWVVGQLRDFDKDEKRFAIDRILTRKNKLARSAPGGKGYEQILCANVDTAFLIVAASQNLNLNSVGRYLELIRENEMVPVVVVTKVESPADRAVLESLSAAIEDSVIGGISVHQKTGLEFLSTHLTPGKTAVLLGASGCGKSTLVNFLLGNEIQKIADVRKSDQKGRHTTTGRRLFSLPNGAMVIDSPGIREIQRWEG
jgi:ribosome biogenesis GTPase